MYIYRSEIIDRVNRFCRRIWNILFFNLIEFDRLAPLVKSPSYVLQFESISIEGGKKFSTDHWTQLISRLPNRIFFRRSNLAEIFFKQLFSTKFKERSQFAFPLFPSRIDRMTAETHDDKRPRKRKLQLPLHRFRETLRIPKWIGNNWLPIFCSS